MDSRQCIPNTPRFHTRCSDLDEGGENVNLFAHDAYGVHDANDGS